MRHIPASFLPPIALEPRSKTPMYRQLYDWFRKAIIDGQMRPGQRVPSTRNLAAELKISRIPVLHAYEQLLAEGRPQDISMEQVAAAAGVGKGTVFHRFGSRMGLMHALMVERASLASARDL